MPRRRSFSSYENLIDGIKKRSQEALQGPVARTIAKEFAKEAKSTAVTGEHSRKSGGIADPKNIEQVDSDTADDSIWVALRNIAKPQKTWFYNNHENFYSPSKDLSGTAFSKMINGDSLDGSYSDVWVDAYKWIKTGYKDPKPRRSSRPFVSNTQDWVNGEGLPKIKKMIENKIYG